MKPWVVMPFIDLWNEFTLQAATDVLTQTAPCRLLLVDNGSGQEDRDAAARWVELHHSGSDLTSTIDRRVMLWHHSPPPPTLDITWNRALEAAWEAGAERALVVNNDVRLPRTTLEHLERAMTETGALFVSAVNVGEDSWLLLDGDKIAVPDFASRGGPDYSCFLISREGHQRFPFDPQFTYCGDLDHHRRIMLAGEGKRIFSVCVPYLHFASRTVVRHPRLALAAEEHRRRYAEKWGGPVNEEVFTEPYNNGSPIVADVAKPRTTPELQRACLTPPHDPPETGMDWERKH